MAKESSGKAERKHSRVEVTHEKVVFSLSPENKEALQKCMTKGDVKITFKEIRVTKLPQTLDDGVKID